MARIVRIIFGLICFWVAASFSIIPYDFINSGNVPGYLPTMWVSILVCFVILVLGFISIGDQFGFRKVRSTTMSALVFTFIVGLVYGNPQLFSMFIMFPRWGL